MRIALVGPEIEENLGLRYLAAALVANGDHAEIVAFDRAADIARVAEAVARPDVDVVGLSMMFQLRAREFVVLAERIRALGWGGTLVAGGQHATFMADEVLADNPAFDAIVLGDGEAPLVELVEALRAGRALVTVPGLVVHTASGAIVHTECRQERTDLDALSPPIRDAHPRLHMGLASAPMIASRGCYASCTFCSIAAWEKLSGGPRYRVRPAEQVAREMADLYHDRGVRVFNFHDDNFWFPRVDANRARLAELARALRANRVGDIALLFKCRPPDVDRELFEQAKDMGLVRIYVGIETDAPAGLVALRRGVAQPQNQHALDVIESLDIHACSNLLLFDPDTRIGDIEHNIAFLERNARHTLNFCRVEPYGGTPLTRRLAAEERLVGDYLGYDYTLREPRVELMWRIAHVAFHDRNFPDDGLANALIALAYRFHLAKRFWPSRELDSLRAPVEELIVRFNREQAAFLRRAYEFSAVAELDDRDAATELAIELAVAVRASDARLVPECDALIATLEGYAKLHGAGGSSGRLGEGAAGSGWWHLGAPLASLALAACMQVADADTPHFSQPPGTGSASGKGKPAVLACSRDGKTRADLLLADPDAQQLVEHAAAQKQKDGSWKTTTADVEGTVRFAPIYARGNGCGGGGFAGWHVTIELSSGDYELVGLAGWTATVGDTIARAPDDRWIRFSVGNPGKATNRIGALVRKRGAPAGAASVAIAADVPPDPTPPPDPRMRRPGCDPVAMPVQMQPPLDSNRVVHLSFATDTSGIPGLFGLQTWIDPNVVKDAQPVGPPNVTSELGTVTVGGFTGADESGGYRQHPAYAGVTIDLRCHDGRVIPRRFKLRATWQLRHGKRVQRYDGSVELELKDDGTIAPVTPGTKHSSLDPLPLGRRYAGAVDAEGGLLRARAPNGVDVLDARWHAVGAEVVTTGDPLAVQLHAVQAGASATCVMRVAGGVCVATWRDV